MTSVSGKQKEKCVCVQICDTFFSCCFKQNKKVLCTEKLVKKKNQFGASGRDFTFHINKYKIFKKLLKGAIEDLSYSLLLRSAISVSHSLNRQRGFPGIQRMASGQQSCRFWLGIGRLACSGLVELI